MQPEWRTGNVLGLCQQMLVEGSVSAMPILADALQDAGFDDEVILSQMRGGELAFEEARRLICLVYSDETAHAVRVVESLAGRISKGYDYDFVGEDDPEEEPDFTSEKLTYAELMQSATEFVTTGEGAYVGSDDIYDIADEDWAEFWKSYSLVTRTEQADRGGFFSCAC